LLIIDASRVGAATTLGEKSKELKTLKVLCLGGVNSFRVGRAGGELPRVETTLGSN
jgi:hypothetical protein